MLYDAAPAQHQTQRQREQGWSATSCQQALQRRRFRHTEARQLDQRDDITCTESLQTANLVRNHRLAKRIAGAGWSAFPAMLVGKAPSAGKQTIAVPPAGTSQRGSAPGGMVWQGSSVRWHRCPIEDCGVRLHRDHNAAKSFLARG